MLTFGYANSEVHVFAREAFVVLELFLLRLGEGIIGGLKDTECLHRRHGMDIATNVVDVAHVRVVGVMSQDP